NFGWQTKAYLTDSIAVMGTVGAPRNRLPLSLCHASGKTGTWSRRGTNNAIRFVIARQALPRCYSSGGRTHWLVTYTHFRLSYPRSPGSPKLGAMLTTSSIVVPHRGHDTVRSRRSVLVRSDTIRAPCVRAAWLPVLY